jgi:hypothetical protein
MRGIDPMMPETNIRVTLTGLPRGSNANTTGLNMVLAPTRREAA